MPALKLKEAVLSRFTCQMKTLLLLFSVHFAGFVDTYVRSMNRQNPSNGIDNRNQRTETDFVTFAVKQVGTDETEALAR